MRDHCARTTQRDKSRAPIILQFTPDGRGRSLYTEAIDLAALGRLKVKRSATVEFDAPLQEWAVRVAGERDARFYHPSRQACLDWERNYFNRKL